jgi:hypothetical protein
VIQAYVEWGVDAMTTALREPFGHPIRNGLAELAVTSHSWQVEVVLFGPDLRYNSTRIIWSEDYIFHIKKIAGDAWRRLVFLRQDEDTKYRQIKSYIDANVYVFLNFHVMSCVSINIGHEIFSDEILYRSFVEDIDQSIARGKILMEKCRKLDGLPPPDHQKLN